MIITYQKIWNACLADHGGRWWERRREDVTILLVLPASRCIVGTNETNCITV